MLKVNNKNIQIQINTKKKISFGNGICYLVMRRKKDVLTMIKLWVSH